MHKLSRLVIAVTMFVTLAAIGAGTAFADPHSQLG